MLLSVIFPPGSNFPKRRHHNFRKAYVIFCDSSTQSFHTRRICKYIANISQHLESRINGLSQWIGIPELEEAVACLGHHGFVSKGETRNTRQPLKDFWCRN